VLVTERVPVSDRQAWLDRLRGLGGYDTYHLPAYQKLCGPPSSRSWLFRYADAEACAGVALTLRPLPPAVAEASGYRFDATSVYGYPGPLLCESQVGPAWRKQFCLWLEDELREMSVLTAFVRGNPLVGDAHLLEYGVFVRQSAGTPTVAVDLIPDAADRLRQASGNHRRQLRKTRAHRLSYGPDHSDSAVAGFLRCYGDTMDRHAASDDYRIDEARFTALLDGLGEHGELWASRDPAGTVVSAGFFLRTNGIIQYHLGGTRAECYELGASRALFEAVAEDGHQRGDRWLHLGGGLGVDGDSLMRFKAGFGPHRFSFSTVRAVLDGPAYTAACRAVGLPQSRPFFPAYRIVRLGV
jgi:hypothetical protein